ncbi:crotonase/enoyl-CoA hydratase family protein [Pseudomonas akapageensis]|uniref:crotonase/enoyl-CoA hydratase family protein n=1 Tax=Pseudomonas akapageensis TaxID=2609961 RepID=UPI00140E32B3|nr:crotonase/enoyl-CoA hydratase family protein [Pseudomonas akapageensis]
MTAQQKYGEVRMTLEDHIAIISVDNAAKLNAFSPEMIEQLAGHLTTVNNDENIWVAVLCPEGEHTTAGLDMPKFFGPNATVKPLPEGWVDPFGLKNRCTKPVISVVHGKTYTVGIEMMLAGDIVIAADTARFCQMESKRGIAPLGGAHFRYLTRAGWGNAMYHLFLCDEFDAKRALEIGFVQEVLPFGEHKERAMEIARLICKNAPIGLRATKAAALKFVQEGEQAAIDCIPAIEKTVFSTEDFKEGLQSFAERRPANFKGH